MFGANLRRLARRPRFYVAALAVVVTMALLYTYQQQGLGDSSAPTGGARPPLPQPPAEGAGDEAAAPAQQASTKCSDLPIPAKYWQMAAVEAFVDMPQPGEVESGSSVCVRVVVPAKELKASASFEPIPATPWDSILLDLVGAKTGISVPVALQMTDHAQNYHRDTTHIYEANVVLRDADMYRPEGYIEYRAAQWNPQDFQSPQPFEPEKLAIADSARITVADRDGLSPFTLQRHLELQLCTEADVDGRWVLASSLPFDAAQVLAPDHTGRVWLPYECRLRPYTYQAYAQCLVRKYPLIHWYGDSNTRRALKKVTSLGQWCSTPEDQASLKCTCNDNSEDFKPYQSMSRIAPVIMDPVTGGSPPLDPNDYAGPVANKSRIVAFKWDGLTDRNSPPWIDYFAPDSMGKLGHPVATIFGATNWDTAFSTHSFFVGEAEQLADKFRAAYPTTPDIYVRTGQYYCCTSDMDAYWKRRYSRLRNRYFDRDLVATFRRRLPAANRVHVWDVALIAERRPYAARLDASKCAANHIRAEGIEVENQVLFNAMCNDLLD
ncbi:hypothetical protein H4R19_005009 [Coemansia spiralis]|nr:hypothetical protein H4R19_005009 [Coemansia spiralis]